jgi:predicted RNA-binding protein with TRAM domain
MSDERRERRSYGGYGGQRRGGGYGERRGYGGYGGQRREGGGFPPKPVEVGKEYDVEIQESSRRGEGIARIKGLVCFVPNSKPGEKVKIRIKRISRRFAEAEVVGEGTAGAETEEEAEEEEEAKTGETKETETAETEETETSEEEE